MAIENILETVAFAMDRGTGPAAPERVICTIREWGPDVEAAIVEHRPTVFHVKGDAAAITATLRGLERFADRVEALILPEGKEKVDLAPVGSFRQMTRLDVPRPIDSIDFSGLAHLREVSVSSAPRLEPLGAAPALDRVTVAEGCKGLRDLHPLAGCTVRELSLFGANSTERLDGIGALPRLEELHLDVNRRLRSVRALSSVRALKRFHIYGSRGVGDLGEIGAHPQLETFSLNNGPVLPTFETFGAMKRLQVFFLNSTNIGPGATRIAPLASLPELRKVTLRAGPTLGFARITDVESFSQATLLDELYLDRMAPLDSFAFVAKLTRLKELTIARTEVRDPDAAPIRGLPHLRQLDLSAKVVKRMAPADVVALAPLLMVNSWGYVYRPAIEAAIKATASNNT